MTSPSSETSLQTALEGCSSFSTSMRLRNRRQSCWRQLYGFCTATTAFWCGRESQWLRKNTPIGNQVGQTTIPWRYDTRPRQKFCETDILYFLALRDETETRQNIVSSRISCNANCDRTYTHTVVYIYGCNSYCEKPELREVKTS